MHPTHFPVMIKWPLTCGDSTCAPQGPKKIQYHARCTYMWVLSRGAFLGCTCALYLRTRPRLSLSDLPVNAQEQHRREGVMINYKAFAWALLLSMIVAFLIIAQ